MSVSLILSLSTFAELPQVPDFAARVDKKGNYWDTLDAADNVAQEWAAGIESTPSEQPLWRGLGLVFAWQGIEQNEPRWSEMESMMCQTYLWSDEESPVSPLGSTMGDPKKGFALLRMFDAYSAGSMSTGLASALAAKPKSFKELYSSLEDVGGVPEWNVFETWLTTIGHPILSTRVELRDGVQGMAYVQKGFTLYPTDHTDNNSTQWLIPVVIAYQDQNKIKYYRTILDSSQGFVVLPSDGKIHWAYANGNGFGWYRTEMPDRERVALNQVLTQLPPEAVVAYSCNQWRLVRHGKAQVSTFFDCIEAGKSLSHLGLADLYALELGTIQRYVRSEDYQAFFRFASGSLREFTRQHGDTMPVEADERTQAILFYGLAWSIWSGDATFERQAQGWAQDWLDEKPLPYPGLHTLSGDQRVFERLLRSAKDSVEATGKLGSEMHDLSNWPLRAESERWVQALLKLPLDKTRRQEALSALCYYPRPRPVIGGMLMTNVDPDIRNEQVLSVLLSTCFRSEVDQLIVSGKLDASTTSKLMQRAITGQEVTLRTLPDQIHQWLEKSPYVN